MNKQSFLFRFLFLSLGLVFMSALSVGDESSNGGGPVLDAKEQAKVQRYTAAVDGYLRGLNEKDLEGILSLYADNATVEDPVGSKIIAGKAAVREFYTGAVGFDLTLTRTGPVRIAGNEAAFPFRLRMEQNGVMMETDIIDLFRFDEAGKIVSMRAFWGPSNRRPATE